MRTFTARRDAHACLGLDVHDETVQGCRDFTSSDGLGGGAIVAVVEPADVRRHYYSPARRRHDRARDRRILLQGQVRSRLHVEVDNPTPTILNFAKSVIAGIRGSRVASRCMRSLLSTGSPCVGVDWRRSGIVGR